MSASTGTIIPFATPTAPAGWLPCDWRVLSQAAYPALFAVIGTIYNEGNEGAGNFRIPDLRGRFIRGVGSDGSGGMTPGTFGRKQDDGMINHIHAINTSTARFVFNGTSGTNYRTVAPCTNVGSPGLGVGNNSGNSATETRPYCIAMLYCIKT